mmetsp:Transcript_2399/g.5443  ORF Transcript_2399/g.5443 Transcript_2399/m.5443 type:complete len:224 (-) Transcript_2399:306-977(-)
MAHSELQHLRCVYDSGVCDVFPAPRAPLGAVRRHIPHGRLPCHIRHDRRDFHTPVSSVLQPPVDRVGVPGVDMVLRFDRDEHPHSHGPRPRTQVALNDHTRIHGVDGRLCGDSSVCGDAGRRHLPHRPGRRPLYGRGCHIRGRETQPMPGQVRLPRDLALVCAAGGPHALAVHVVLRGALRWAASARATGVMDEGSVEAEACAVCCAAGHGEPLQVRAGMCVN